MSPMEALYFDSVAFAGKSSPGDKARQILLEYSTS